MNILIVEDDTYYRDLLVKIVESFGHDVTWADTGRAALEKAAAMDFDLFVMDVFLPDMTAMDLIPRLRNIRTDPLVITVTGMSSRELERELRELGIAYYMAKPIPASELKSILEHLSKNRKPPSGPPACPCHAST